MHIERLQVESEGFLAGLDIRFTPGLNVLIGARGTGKTSIVELIRYCTGAGSFTEDAGTRGAQQAIAILDGGAATLTIVDKGLRYEITRSAAGHVTSSPLPTLSCTVLAQNEVEAVGAQDSGRLHLLDRFRPKRDEDQQALETLQLQLRSQTVEIAALVSEGRSLVEEIESLSSIEVDLASALQAQQAILEESDATDVEQSDLRLLQENGRMIANREETLLAETDRITALASALGDLQRHATSLLHEWPADAGADPIPNRTDAIGSIGTALASANEAVGNLAGSVARARVDTQELKVAIDHRSRELRQKLDALQKGIGQASRTVAALEERHGRLQALRSVLDDRRRQYRALVDERDATYTRLDARRSEVFQQRLAVTENLNERLSPSIKIVVTRSQNVDDYTSAITSALRGTGIHYNSIAPQIAMNISPLEITQWAETTDVEALTSILSIKRDRAQSILDNLAGQRLGAVASATVEDGVKLYLLDGPEYKPSDQLSIGQRCTAVLPILLGTHGDPLVVDQPEDHLDNAFVTSTLVASLLRREPTDQLIFSSHNANIPVLGEADRVIVMESDGTHGYVVHQGILEEPETVRHITRIMEGGREAFQARSLFYGTE